MLSPLLLFSRREFDRLAELIDTGPDSDMKRSLVVFNPTSVPVTGRAIFPVDMPWRRSEPFPQVTVRDLETDRIALHEIDGVRWSEWPAAEKATAADKQRLRFLMVVCATAVPANGYATYVAAFNDETGEQPGYDRPVFRPDLVVVENRGHGGSLPSRGALVAANDSSLILYVDEPQSALPGVVQLTIANNSRQAATEKKIFFKSPILRASRPDGKQAAALIVDGNALVLPPIGAGDALKLNVEVSV